MTIKYSLKNGIVYENEIGDKRLVTSVNEDVVIWRTANSDLPLGTKSHGSATVTNFLKWKAREHKASEYSAFDIVIKKENGLQLIIVL